MIQGIDRTDINHGQNLLIKSGIANTEMVTREYILKDNSIIDAYGTYGVTGVGTHTITKLPNNTAVMYIGVQVYRTGAFNNIVFKRFAAGISSQIWLFGPAALAGNQYAYWNGWIFTKGNQFHIDTLTSAIANNYFNIYAYKVKE